MTQAQSIVTVLDISDSIDAIEERFTGRCWADVQRPAAEHARCEAGQIAEAEGLTDDQQAEIEDALHDAAFGVAI